MTNTNQLHLLPQPNQIEFGEGSLTLNTPIDITIGEAIEDMFNVTLEHMLPAEYRDRLNVQSESGIGRWLQVGEIFLPEAPPEAESYRLQVGEEGLALVSFNEDGFRNGLRTFFQLISQASLISDDKTSITLPHVDITDKPSIPGRAFMIDMVRCKEKDEVYFRLLEEIAAWKMNVLFLHFMDNQGCTIELKSHPEVVSPFAMSQETLARLIQRGKELGVRIIGEVEPWGHAKWLTNVYPEFGEPGTNSLCLCQKGIYPILEDVIEEVASLFPDPYLHVGLDEADFSDDCPLCPERRKAGELELIANHINRINRVAKKCGKTSMMWADIILHRREILPLLDRDIITEDWNYYIDVSPDGLQTLSSLGFRTWAAPALVMGSWRITPANYNLENVRTFTKIARQENAEGIATTAWLPQRYIPSTLGRGIVYAADLAWGDEERSMDEIYADYLVHRYGLKPSANRIDLLQRLGTAGQRNPGQAFWGNKETLAARTSEKDRTEDEQYISAVRGLTAGLTGCLGEVKQNQQEWECLVFVGRIAEHIADRRIAGREVVELIEKAGDDPSLLLEAAKKLDVIEKDRAELYQKMRYFWDLDRHADDPIKDGTVGQTNNLWFWFGHADSYGYTENLLKTLKELAKNPDKQAISYLIAPDKPVETEDEKAVHVDS